MSEEQIIDSILEEELITELSQENEEDFRPTCYKSFVISVSDQKNYFLIIGERINQDWESDVIEAEYLDEETSRTSIKISEKLESPRGFQNPLIMSKTSEGRVFSTQEIQKDNNSNRSFLSSLKTIQSLYFPSSYHSSEQEYKANSFEKESKNSDSNRSPSFSYTNLSDENLKTIKELSKLCIIGEGSEAQVYLCELEGSENLVAYKQFKQNRISFSKVEREFKLIETLDHPNIINYSYLKAKNHQRDSYGIVMEFMEGETLLDYVNSNFQNMTYELKLNLARQIINGVEYLHIQNIVHGDLKADMWSLGIVLHFLFNGFHPFDKISRVSELQKIFENIYSLQFKSEDQITNNDIGNFIQRCLVPDPQKRLSFTDLSYNLIT